MRGRFVQGFHAANGVETVRSRIVASRLSRWSPDGELRPYVISCLQTTIDTFSPSVVVAPIATTKKRLRFAYFSRERPHLIFSLTAHLSGLQKV